VKFLELGLSPYLSKAKLHKLDSVSAEDYEPANQSTFWVQFFATFEACNLLGLLDVCEGCSNTFF